MKKNKFLLFALLALTCFGMIEIFLLPFFRAYSQENKNSNSKIDNSNCYKKYELNGDRKVYPEAEAYCDALANTKIARKEQIWRNLTPVVWYNEKLIRENNKKNGRVLVTTWTKYKKYKEGQETAVQRDIWVTIVPELQDFCKEYDKSKEITLDYRLNQVLGLPPETSEDYEKRKLLEIWVEPKYLFRPTPDPEITDREAELDFPQSHSWVFVSYKYKLWFLNQLMTNDYPWTKLGYTYDWGNKDDWNKIDRDRPANVGLSEFIIRKGAPIKINSIHKAKDYCSNT